jgi:hypothetical protein
MLKYTRIYSNISLSNKREACWTDKIDGQPGWTFGRMNNPKVIPRACIMFGEGIQVDLIVGLGPQGIEDVSYP